MNYSLSKDHKFVLVTRTTLFFLFSSEVLDNSAHLISPLHRSSDGAAESDRLLWLSSGAWSAIILSACLCLATSLRCAISSCVSGLNTQAQTVHTGHSRSLTTRRHSFITWMNVYNFSNAFDKKVWAREILDYYSTINRKTRWSATKVTSR